MIVPTIFFIFANCAHKLYKGFAIYVTLNTISAFVRMKKQYIILVVHYVVLRVVFEVLCMNVCTINFRIRFIIAWIL